MGQRTARRGIPRLLTPKVNREHSCHWLSALSTSVPENIERSVMSEIRAVLRTQIPKDGSVPAMRGGTMPIATAISPATRHEWTSVPETRTMIETFLPGRGSLGGGLPSQSRYVQDEQGQGACSDGTCRRSRKAAEGFSRAEPHEGGCCSACPPRTVIATAGTTG